jgi:hypothetical protein
MSRTRPPRANPFPPLEGLDLQRPPFSILWPQGGPDAPGPRNVSYRQATDEHWASLRYEIPLIDEDGPLISLKQWVNDWWPPTCPDLPMRDRGRLIWVPPCTENPDPPKPTWWVAGLHHHGTPGLSAHIAGTNIEVSLPESLLPHDPLVRSFLSRLRLIAQATPSWYKRAYHPHRDIPDRGWGDGLVASLDWAPWFAAPEHPDSPPPDLLASHLLPPNWHTDATGARSNPRLGHHERQWVVVDKDTGDPLLWARATPLSTRHRHPLLVRVDARYRLEWEETPVGWAGSLDPEHGHHVVLLERGDLRIEAWVGLAAGMDRRQAAHTVDRAFQEP